MKYDYFFELAKQKGIEECELKISESYSLSFSLFHSEMDDYQVNNGYSIIARGLINGKFGTASCDVWLYTISMMHFIPSLWISSTRCLKSSIVPYAGLTDL